MKGMFGHRRGWYVLVGVTGVVWGVSLLSAFFAMGANYGPTRSRAFSSPGMPSVGIELDHGVIFFFKQGFSTFPFMGPTLDGKTAAVSGSHVFFGFDRLPDPGLRLHSDPLYFETWLGIGRDMLPPTWGLDCYTLSVIYPCGLMGLLTWFTRPKARPRPGMCAGCGYDLRMTPERCPECGRGNGVGERASVVS